MHDVVIVGAGLSGMWAAKHLAEAGARVLVLEAGPDVSAHALAIDSADNARWQAAARRRAVQSRHPAFWMHNPELFVDDTEHPYRSAADPFVWIRGRQVGGRGLTWGGVTLRFSEYEFQAAARDGFGTDWPITYEQLAPYFAEVETFFSVSGRSEGLSQLPDGVFVPPPPLTDDEARFKCAVETRWSDRRVTHCRAVSTPTGNQNHEWPPSSAQHRMIPDALRTGRVEIKPNAVVSRLLVDSSGQRVVGAECVDRLTKSRFVVPGRSAVLCASTIESVRILLQSRSREHPNGLGNSSGCLGKYLLDHAATTLVGPIPGEFHTQDAPFGGPHGVVIPRFRNLDEPRSDFLRGYGIWGNLGRRAWSTNEPMWTLCAMLEVLPRRENCIEIDADCTDAWGIQTPVICMAYSQNEQRMLDDAERSMQEMVDLVGWRVARRTRMVPGSFVHELGGARMGTDTSESVLDSSNRCWDVPNLFVLDGASFVSSGWQNPTLTLLAIAGRGARILGRHLSEGDL